MVSGICHSYVGMEDLFPLCLLRELILLFFFSISKFYSLLDHSLDHCTYIFNQPYEIDINIIELGVKPKLMGVKPEVLLMSK